MLYVIKYDIDSTRSSGISFCFHFFFFLVIIAEKQALGLGTHPRSVHQTSHAPDGLGGNRVRGVDCTLQDLAGGLDEQRAHGKDKVVSKPFLGVG